MKRLVIGTWQENHYCAIYDENRMVGLNLEPKDEPSLLGNIYIGKVKKIVSNIHAAFLDIGEGMDCYLPVEETKQAVFTKKVSANKLCVGDELIVQVTKEAQKMKAPTLTANLSFSGQYIVLTSANRTVGISKKITGQRRVQLQQCIADDLPEHFGVIVRTNAKDASEEEITAELRRLTNEAQTLIENGMHRTAFSVLKSALPSYLNEIKNSYTGEYDEIVTDDPELYEEIRAFLAADYADILPKLRLYQDQLLSMNKLYSLEANMEKALRRHVWLKSGGFLVIEPTEALTVIDVNSGKNISGKNKKESIVRLNKEAAEEIARQIRLRNLSGIIIIDFVDMEEEKDKEELAQWMQSLLNSDPVTANVVDLTALGLMELTRKKIRKPLHEQIKKYS
jgi:ribonuclease G